MKAKSAAFAEHLGTSKSSQEHHGQELLRKLSNNQMEAVKYQCKIFLSNTGIRFGQAISDEGICNS